MPFHFDSLTENSPDEGVLTYLLQNGLNDIDGVIADEDETILHFMRYMRDMSSGERIGKFVFTFSRDEKQNALSLLDVDITLDGGNSAEVRFLRKLPGSSDANEYYDIEAVEEGHHLQIETVNRQFIRSELVDTTQKILPSAFPFRLTVYDSMDDLNESLGLKHVKNEDTGMTVGGLSPTFTAPGSLAQIGNDEEEEAFSILVGTVKGVRDVTVDFGERKLSFAIAVLDSALGPLPTAMGREVFDLSELMPGKVIMMYADIKADFAIDQ